MRAGSLASRAGLRPTSELDSVMEFDLSGAMQLASSSLAGRRPVRELVADLVSDLPQTCRDSSNLVADRFAAGLRPARELLVSWIA